VRNKKLRYYDMKLQENLKNLIKINKLNYAQFGDIIGKSEATVGNWCVGKTSPDASDLIKIADAFKIKDLNEFLTGKKNEDINEDLKNEAFKYKTLFDYLTQEKKQIWDEIKVILTKLTDKKTGY
jgi:transcriptional regulator with XRE-family HTH domain